MQLSLYGQNTIVIHPDNRVASIQLSAADYDSFINDTYSLDKVTKSLYGTFKDDFDFIVLVLNEAVIPTTLNTAGTNTAVSNATTNIGRGAFNNGSYYGSTTGKLKSVLRLNRIDFITNGPFLHELSHTWGQFLLPTKDFSNFGTDATSVSTGSHWGVTGGSTKGQLGGFLQSSLVELGNNTYTVGSFGGYANGGNGIPYNEMELYLMGMIPLSSVSNFDYFTDLSSFISNGESVNRTYTFVAATRTTVTPALIASTYGVRSPDSNTSQKNFKALTVIVTQSPVTTAQWDTVNQQAANFSLAGSDGQAAYNFWEATNGIGTFETANIQNSTLSIVEDQLGEISIYPNPTADYVNIKTAEKIKTIELYSLLGQKIKISAESNRVNLSSVPSGVYNLRLTTENNQIQTFKIVKK